jgi:hypothetical protein
VSLLPATGAGGAVAEAGFLHFGRVALQVSKPVLRVTAALLLGLSFNLYRLGHRYLFSRMSTELDNF